jgi:hypothetical protein
MFYIVGSQSLRTWSIFAARHDHRLLLHVAACLPVVHSFLVRACGELSDFYSFLFFGAVYSPLSAPAKSTAASFEFPDPALPSGFATYFLTYCTLEYSTFSSTARHCNYLLDVFLTILL